MLVLDTNIVLDWLLFDDPSCAGLAAAIASQDVRWIASTAMHGELRHVLARGIPSKRAGDPAAVLRGWERWVEIVEPRDLPPVRSMRCSDADDQMFIDLALQARATALVSRDRAVLRLARRAAPLGLAIVSARDWTRR